MKIIFSAFAIVATMQAAPCQPLNVQATDDPAPAQPLTLDTADQYLGDPNFYGQVWDPALMALGTGEHDPQFQNILDVRRFQPREQLPGQIAPANEAVALDAGPISCPGGFAVRTVDNFGQIRTVRITVVPDSSGSEQNPRLAKLIAISSEDQDLARELIHFGRELGRRHELSVPMGSGRLRLSAQLNSDRQAAPGNESPVDAAISFDKGGLSVSVNPQPLYNNQIANRLMVVAGSPAAATHFTLRNIRWRRAVSYLDSSQAEGGAWVAGASTAVGKRTVLSAAVSAWSDKGGNGNDAMITGQYRTGNDSVYGLGLMGASGSISPFASFGRSLAGGGRLYLSVGAPLDDHTRVPVACRMSMPF